MSPFVKKLAIETGKSEEEVAVVWESSKKLTAETFGIEEKDFTKREIMYVKEIVRDSLGVRREISLADFMSSDKSARDFIDEVVQSSDSFGINKSLQKRDGTGPYGKGLGPGGGKGCDINDDEEDEESEVIKPKLKKEEIEMETKTKKDE